MEIILLLAITFGESNSAWHVHVVRFIHSVIFVNILKFK